MSHSPRSILSIAGDDRVHFLQGILTQDVTKLAAEKIQFAALLSPQGKILNDMFLIDEGEHILLDTASEFKDILLKRLAMYKLRAKVTITDISATHQVSLGHGLPDPRHPDLPKRAYTPSPPAGEGRGEGALELGASLSPPPHHTSPAGGEEQMLGIPVLGRDFVPDEVVPMDAGYDLLHAISFTKGCYVGQEITARMHYKQIARRGFYILESTTGPARLALLKFEDVEKNNGLATVDNHTYTARLPAWMQPKLDLFRSAAKNQ